MEPTLEEVVKRHQESINLLISSQIQLSELLTKVFIELGKLTPKV